jgi:undecaprenyl pyrophosphate phosphatase UppP
MLFAAVHLSPYVSLPIAAGLAAVMIWYWFRIGRPIVPVSRRKIRRFSIAVMLLSLPVFVRGLSFLDHQNPADKQQYVMTWTIATFMLLMVVATALMDAINSLRLHQRHQHQAMHDTAAELANALQRRREMEATGRAPASDDPATPNGHGRDGIVEKGA